MLLLTWKNRLNGVMGSTVSFQKICWHPNIQYLRMWLTLATGLLQMSLVYNKVTLGYNGPLIQYDWCPCKNRRDSDSQTLWLQRQRLKWCIYKPRNTKVHQKPRDAPPLGPSASMALPAPWFQMSTSRTVRQYISCFKPTSLWCFVTVALGN